jgi:hypothetical protein|tara:strand:+ start:2059 stop:2331 length:273 start_codon:yes stop_codon:yes gene_type:complete
MSKIRVLQTDCDPQLAEDRTLPYTSYIVCYLIEGTPHYDIVTSSKNVDIFDHYWDRYKQDLQWYKQTEGRISPKLWQDPNKPQAKVTKGK